MLMVGLFLMAGWSGSKAPESSRTELILNLCAGLEQSLIILLATCLMVHVQHQTT